MLDAGCVACLLRGHPRQPGEIHHLLSGGRRRGHEFSVCLCPGHHRAVCDLPYKEWKEIHGPSLAKEPRKFKEEFGDDEFLLEIQENIVRGYLAAWASEYS